MKYALTRRLRWFLVLSVVATQVWAQSAGPTFPNPGNTSMSKEEQQTLGMQVAAQVYEQMPVLPDNSVETQYVRKLGQKLVATIPQEYSWPFEFHVIPQKEINAFALPGGQMFINIGTITAAKNEAELAGVMAHEMAHVYMQHSAKQASKAQT
ncbi:MAG TPA: M48 family metalloprotease [Pyrinomonadaceae bacterium]